MFKLLKGIAITVILVFVISCGLNSGYIPSEKPRDTRIRICVTNHTIDAMNVRLSAEAGSKSVHSRESRWIFVKPEQLSTSRRITAYPVGGGDMHYSELWSLRSAQVWEWAILTFPSSTLNSLQPARGSTACD